MIDAGLANKFIKKAADYTEQNINVMNENGIIVASTDSSRIGSFHEIAYEIMSADKDIIEVVGSDRFQGGRKGINMALMYKKKKIGVVGVTGEPAEIKDIAMLVKMALETMLEYEIQNRKNFQQKSLKNRFVDGLLYQEEADKEGELTAVSEKLGYNPHLIRIPILIIFDKQVDAQRLMDNARGKYIWSLQDIVATTRSNNLIIFKSFQEQKDIFSQYKYLIKEVLIKLKDCFEQQTSHLHFYIGSFQQKYCFYRKSFQHCNWLKEFCLGKEEYFFYDYVGDYMRNMIPVIELNCIFSPLCKEIDDEKKDSIIKIIETMDRNNYNLNESSKELYIHKNTLIFRYNKIKSLFNVNPIQNTADRELLNWLIMYFKKNR